MATTANPDAILAKMVKAGAVMEIYQPRLTFSLGYAKTVAPGSLAWVPMWPNQMQDGHLLQFARAVVMYDRDVIWYDDQDRIIAQAVPWQEAASLPSDYLETLPTWQAYMVNADAVQRIHSWLNNNLGTKLPVG